MFSVNQELSTVYNMNGIKSLHCTYLDVGSHKVLPALINVHQSELEQFRRSNLDYKFENLSTQELRKINDCASYTCRVEPDYAPLAV